MQKTAHGAFCGVEEIKSVDDPFVLVYESFPCFLQFCGVSRPDPICQFGGEVFIQENRAQKFALVLINPAKASQNSASLFENARGNYLTSRVHSLHSASE